MFDRYYIVHFICDSLFDGRWLFPVFQLLDNAAGKSWYVFYCAHVRFSEIDTRKWDRLVLSYERYFFLIYLFTWERNSTSRWGRGWGREDLKLTPEHRAWQGAWSHSPESNFCLDIFFYTFAFNWDFYYLSLSDITSFSTSRPCCREILVCILLCTCAILRDRYQKVG